MQCQRLLKQTKAWYIHVINETMAPARMISFIQKHAATCDVCLEDPDLDDEIEKITEMILPDSKIPKAVRMQKEQDDMDSHDSDEDDDIGLDDDVEVDEEDDDDDDDDDDTDDDDDDDTDDTDDIDDIDDIDDEELDELDIDKTL